MAKESQGDQQVSEWVRQSSAVCVGSVVLCCVYQIEYFPPRPLSTV